jgi:hypothetical protein
VNLPLILDLPAPKDNLPKFFWENERLQMIMQPIKRHNTILIVDS